MIILNHPKIPGPKLVPVESREEIGRVPASSIPLLPFDLDLLAYCQREGIRYGVTISSIKEAVYSNALGASYLICPTLSLARQVEEVAENYLFDGKVIVTIDERLIEEAIGAGIDGVWLTETVDER
ncbi:MAG: hypothetical protein GXO19_02815 [Epsilonproteobacteria bacterium]|nr:hypothetical protein [Campylobacterota bacterium]NPA56651.1 hypothetical protein [Campylobacterota bacterium]